MSENRHSKISAKPSAPEELMEIGRIVKAHGIRGELCVDYNAESSSLLKGFVYLKPDSGPGVLARKYPVRTVRMHKGRPLLVLEGVNDRNQADLLRNFVLLIPKDRLPELSPDEIYLSQLPGLVVYLHPDYGHIDSGAASSTATDDAPSSFTPAGQPLGRLDSVADVAGQEIWTITTTDGQEILLPANEEFVREINLDQNYAVICPPPGLLEIYLK